jgi:hypothetical protein
MKKTSCLLALLLLTGLGGTTHAQVQKPKPKTARKSTQVYCLMKDGNMLVVKDGKMSPMTVSVTMGDGSLCMPDGTCQSEQGHTMMLQEGQSKMMDGTVTMYPDKHPGHPVTRPKK